MPSPAIHGLPNRRASIPAKIFFVANLSFEFSMPSPPTFYTHKGS
jgi:hypothetical protein